MNKKPARRDDREEQTPEESIAAERTEANQELAEAFNDTEAHQTRLEEIAAEEGDEVEEHEHESDRSAEEKANDILNDGVIVRGGG